MTRVEVSAGTNACFRPSLHEKSRTRVLSRTKKGLLLASVPVIVPEGPTVSPAGKADPGNELKTAAAVAEGQMIWLPRTVQTLKLFVTRTPLVTLLSGVWKLSPRGFP